MAPKSVPCFFQTPIKTRVQDRKEEKQEDEYDHEDEQEEALSLSDLPLNKHESNQHNDSQYDRPESLHRSILSDSPSEVTDSFFEFFSSFSSEMSPAEEMIFCGKLIPFSDQLPSLSTNENQNEKPINQKIRHPRRSESLSYLQNPVSRSNSVSKSRPLMRNSRSLDDRALRSSNSRALLSPEHRDRNPSSKRVGKPDPVQWKKACKPRWYLFMFGLVKFPTEMGLHDIKNRQLKRNQSTTMFSVTDLDGKLPVNQNNSGKASWRILKALSCKDHSSVAVTMSFQSSPQA